MWPPSGRWSHDTNPRICERELSVSGSRLVMPCGSLDNGGASNTGALFTSKQEMTSVWIFLVAVHDVG